MLLVGALIEKRRINTSVTHNLFCHGTCLVVALPGSATDHVNGDREFSERYVGFTRSNLNYNSSGTLGSVPWPRWTVHVVRPVVWRSDAAVAALATAAKATRPRRDVIDRRKTGDDVTVDRRNRYGRDVVTTSRLLAARDESIIVVVALAVCDRIFSSIAQANASYTPTRKPYGFSIRLPWPRHCATTVMVIIIIITTVIISIVY